MIMFRKLLRVTAFTLLLCTTYQWIFAQYFSVDGRKLMDANGNEFIIRGMNNPHIWISGPSYRALDRISELNTNCIRIVWMTKGKSKELDKIIRKCLELKLIPMVELHDVTGGTTSEGVMQMVDYYLRPDIKEVLLAHEKYLLLNIANEWGDHFTTSEFWYDTYKQAVDSLRKAGYKTTVVIDGSGWGQKLQPILDFGSKLLEKDPLHNLLFSVHMYGSWNDAEKIKSELQAAYDHNLPLIVGEFGYNYNDGANNLKCKVDHRVILETCQQLKYGYIPWSWTGNNEENAWLDIADPKDWKTLTWWGREVYEDENGINATGRRCSLFE
jgi:mannan endo-1,4-beta-mannosidase